MIPPGTVCCILCRGMIAYRNSDTARFNNHMNYEHGAYFDMEFLLAACLMDEEERKAVRNVMELKYKSQKKVEPEIKTPNKRPNSSLTNVENSKAKVPRTESVVVVKQEVSDEVRVLPENWDVPKSDDTTEPEKENEGDQKVMFKCDGCDKSFLHRKSLQSHQSKTGHTPTPPAPQSNDFSCKVPNCKYVGSKNKDLQSHGYRMHRNVSSATPPPPPKSATPPPASPSSDQSAVPSNVLFNNMAKSWAKKKVPKTPAKPPKTPLKAPKVKKEPVDSSKNESLQEMSESKIDDSSVLNSSNVSESSFDSSADTPMDPQSSTESKTVEDTTFVSIDSSSLNDTENLDEVNISKSKYFKANPQTVSTLSDKAGAGDQFSVLDEKLPLGWKVKEIIHEFKSGRKERKRNYLTPDSKILKTGLAVLEYMRLSGKYSAKEIMDYAKYLSVPVNRLEKYMELYL